MEIKIEKYVKHVFCYRMLMGTKQIVCVLIDYNYYSSYLMEIFAVKLDIT